MESVELGAKVKDKVSGISGTVTAICKYMCSPDRVEVTYEKEREVKELWLPIGRLEFV